MLAKTMPETMRLIIELSKDIRQGPETLSKTLEAPIIFCGGFSVACAT